MKKYLTLAFAPYFSKFTVANYSNVNWITSVIMKKFDRHNSSIISSQIMYRYSYITLSTLQISESSFVRNIKGTSKSHAIE